jgi:hypothetical protein
VNAADSISGKIAWGPWIIVVSGVVLSLGTGLGLLTRFIVVSRLSHPDFFYSFFPMSLQHARLASLIPLFMGGILIFSFLAIDVTLGLTMMGA